MLARVDVRARGRRADRAAAVATNLGVRLGTHRWRAGLFVNLVLALREDDARLWLGLAAGPSFRDLDALVNGFSAFVSLDVAVPISKRFAIDTIVRGGFDEALSAPTPRPDPLGEFVLGVTWS